VVSLALFSFVREINVIMLVSAVDEGSLDTSLPAVKAVSPYITVSPHLTDAINLTFPSHTENPLSPHRASTVPFIWGSRGQRHPPVAMLQRWAGTPSSSSLASTSTVTSFR